MKFFNFDEIKSQADCLQIARELGLNPNNQGRCAAVWREGKNPNVAINKDGWYDHKDKNKGSVIDLVALAKFSGCVQQAQQWLGEYLRLIPRHDTVKARQRKRAISDAKLIAKTYDYKNIKNEVVSQTVRFEPKGFSQRRPDKNGGWIWDLKGVDLVLYRLPELLKDIEGKKTIYLCEGEKCSDNLRQLGVAATCNPLGAGKWRDSYTETLAGADLVIIADRDDAGRSHAQTVRSAVSKVVKSIRIIEMPDRAGKAVKDASDWISEGGTLSELEEIVQNAPEAPADAPEQDARAVEPIGAGEWLLQPDEPDRPIIKGLIDEGDRVAVVAPSKGRKSFLTLQLAVNIATGSDFLGKPTTAPYKVLLFNGENLARKYKTRLRDMLNGMTVNRELLNNLKVLNTSDSTELTTFETLLRETIKQNCEVCIIDPAYLLIDDEIDPRAAKDAVRKMKRFTAEGITLICVYHATKGMMGDKQGIDRISGSGVFARDVSTLITLCDHASEPDHKVITAITRNYPDSGPITAHFNNGAFTLTDVAPIEKNSSTRAKRVIPLEDALKHFPEEGNITYGEAIERLKEKLSIGRNRAVELIGELSQKKMVFSMKLGRATLYSVIKKEDVV